VEDLLRGRLGFDGAVLADAPDAAALRRWPRAHVRALTAGCDGLLCPSDPQATARELLEAVEAGALPLGRLAVAAGRMRALRDRLTPQVRGAPSAGAVDGARFAAEAADAALCLSTRRWAWRRGRPCEVLAPLHPARSQEARAGIERLRRALAGSARPAGVVLPVVGAGEAGGVRCGPSAAELAPIEAKIASLRELGWRVGLVWLASPRTLPAAWWQRPELPVLLAFSPFPPMVEAVERWLAGRSRAGGSLPCGLG
jgi:hypothetical protein